MTGGGYIRWGGGGSFRTFTPVPALGPIALLVDDYTFS